MARGATPECSTGTSRGGARGCHCAKKTPKSVPSLKGSRVNQVPPRGERRSRRYHKKKDVLLTNEASKLLTIKGRPQKTNPSKQSNKSHGTQRLSCVFRLLVWFIYR